jgi:hypothetical protein
MEICAVFEQYSATVQYTVYSMQYTVYSMQYTVYSIQYAVYSIQYAVYSIQYTVYSLCVLCLSFLATGKRYNVLRVLFSKSFYVHNFWP